MRHYEVRFHLGAGEHYKHWQMKSYHNGNLMTVSYWNPEHYEILMSECQLINRPKKAAKVFESQKRDVCGWIKCYGFILSDIASCGATDIKEMKMVVYDPKVQKYWHYENSDEDIDCKIFDKLVTRGKRVYANI